MSYIKNGVFFPVKSDIICINSTITNNITWKIIKEWQEQKEKKGAFREPDNEKKILKRFRIQNYTKSSLTEKWRCWAKWKRVNTWPQILCNFELGLSLKRQTYK